MPTLSKSRPSTSNRKDEACKKVEKVNDALKTTYDADNNSFVIEFRFQPNKNYGYGHTHMLLEKFQSAAFRVPFRNEEARLVVECLFGTAINWMMRVYVLHPEAGYLSTGYDFDFKLDGEPLLSHVRLRRTDKQTGILEYFEVPVTHNSLKFQVTITDHPQASFSDVDELSSKMAKLFDDPEHSDIKLIVDDKAVYASRTILCASSPALKQLINAISEMQQPQSAASGCKCSVRVGPCRRSASQKRSEPRSKSPKRYVAQPAFSRDEGISPEEQKAEEYHEDFVKKAKSPCSLPHLLEDERFPKLADYSPLMRLVASDHLNSSAADNEERGDKNQDNNAAKNENNFVQKVQEVAENVASPSHIEVHMKDIGIEALRAFVRYTYTATVTFASVPMAFEVLHAADTYDMAKLKVNAEKYIASRLSRDNAVEALVKGNKYNSKTISDAALDVIYSHSHDIDNIPGYAQVKKDGELCSKIIQFLATKCQRQLA